MESLSKATTVEGTSTYKYNGEGYRTEKTENGKTTISLYEAGKVILETDANGKEIARNLYGTNLISRTVTETSTLDAASWGVVRSLIKTPSAIAEQVSGEDSWTELYDNTINNAVNSRNFVEQITKIIK